MADDTMEVKPDSTDSSPVEEQAVQPETPAAQPQSDIEAQPELTPPVDGNPQVDAFDENGVPWKNRYFEWKRKAEDMAEKLPSLVEDKIKNAFQQYGNQQQQREYTISELEAYALDHPEHRAWAEEQKEAVRQKQNRKMFEEIVGEREKKRESDSKKQQTLEIVMREYPEAFNRDAQGRINGWNNQSPFTQQIGLLMQDPRLANDPEGLKIAADIAYARIARGQQLVVRQQQQQLKQEVGDLKKKTLVEGGGRSSQPVSDPVRTAISSLKKTGSMKDAERAMAEIFRKVKPKLEE